MEESKKIKREIGECFCLQSPYKHFIIASIEESIHMREEEIDIIKQGIKKGGDTIKIRGIIEPKKAEIMINVHRSTREELIKVMNMVHNIPSC